MTPKEKAEGLFNKYYSYLKSNLMDDKEAIEDAKQCALIAVDFVKDSKYFFMPMYGGWESGQQYYDKVKQEIEKL